MSDLTIKYLYVFSREDLYGPEGVMTGHPKWDNWDWDIDGPGVEDQPWPEIDITPTGTLTLSCPTTFTDAGVSAGLVTATLDLSLPNSVGFVEGDVSIPHVAGSLNFSNDLIVGTVIVPTASLTLSNSIIASYVINAPAGSLNLSCPLDNTHIEGDAIIDTTPCDLDLSRPTGLYAQVTTAFSAKSGVFVTPSASLTLDSSMITAFAFYTTIGDVTLPALTAEAYGSNDIDVTLSALSVEGYAAYADTDVTFPALTISGTGYATSEMEGDVLLPGITAVSYIGGYTDVTLPALTISSAAVTSSEADGAVVFLPLSVLAEMQDNPEMDGAVTLPGLSASGDMDIGTISDGDVVLFPLAVNATMTIGASATAGVAYLTKLSVSGAMSGTGTNDGDVVLSVFAADGYQGEVASEVLRYVRDNFR